MTDLTTSIGIVGGSGMLGSAILAALLDRGGYQGGDVWVSNSRGIPSATEVQLGVHVTDNTQALADACDIIILCVPPDRFFDLTLVAKDKLIMSVMAGVTIETLAQRTGADRVIRAMSSPAASIGLAYSPWMSSENVTSHDRKTAQKIFESCGKTDEVFDEDHLDHFTAMTGPVPGFVGYIAQVMVDHAVDQGIAPDVADRAIRQLFLGSATLMAESSLSPAQHVQAMIDYDGTTAAGLKFMMHSPLSEILANGLKKSMMAAKCPNKMQK